MADPKKPGPVLVYSKEKIKSKSDGEKAVNYTIAEINVRVLSANGREILKFEDVIGFGIVDDDDADCNLAGFMRIRLRDKEGRLYRHYVREGAQATLDIEEILKEVEPEK